MRKTILTLAALFLFTGVPALGATEPGTDDVRISEVTPQISAADAPASGELQLETIQIEQRNGLDDTAAAQFAPRGSFWWLVGVVVVAGVILAVVL